jgi:hypothetical protein
MTRMTNGTCTFVRVHIMTPIEVRMAAAGHLLWTRHADMEGGVAENLAG